MLVQDVADVFQMFLPSEDIAEHTVERDHIRVLIVATNSPKQAH